MEVCSCDFTEVQPHPPRCRIRWKIASLFVGSPVVQSGDCLVDPLAGWLTDHYLAGSLTHSLTHLLAFLLEILLCRISARCFRCWNLTAQVGTCLLACFTGCSLDCLLRPLLCWTVGCFVKSLVVGSLGCCLATRMVDSFVYRRIARQLAWLLGWLVGWSVGRLVGWLVVRFVGRLVGWSLARLLACLLACLLGWSAGLLACLPACLLTYLLPDPLRALVVCVVGFCVSGGGGSGSSSSSFRPSFPLLPVVCRASTLSSKRASQPASILLSLSVRPLELAR